MSSNIDIKSEGTKTFSLDISARSIEFEMWDDQGIDLDMMHNRVEIALPKVKDPIIEYSTENKKSDFSFLWFQCSQCGWGERMSKAEAQADGWENGSACPHCGIGPIRSSPMGRFG